MTFCGCRGSLKMAKVKIQNALLAHEKAEAFLDRVTRVGFGMTAEIPKVMRLREDLELGQFAQAYNHSHGRRFVYAEHHTRKSCRGDFAVFDSSRSVGFAILS